MNYGKTITSLRKQRGMTQAELGSALNVTYQAVSKWENDLSQPGLDTITDICKIFDITMDEFVNMASGNEVEKEPTTKDSESVLTEEKTASIIREELNRIEQQKQEEIRKKRQKELEAKKKEEEREKALEEFRKKEEERKNKIRYRIGFGITCAVTAIILLLTFANINQWYSNLICAYAAFAFGMHMGHDCFIADFFEGAWESSFHMPGVIFSFDIDGILFLLLYKVIIAPIITAVVTLAVGIGGTFLSLAMSMVVFPFKMFSLFRETFGKSK